MVRRVENKVVVVKQLMVQWGVPAFRRVVFTLRRGTRQDVALR
jgi:hypothetical protein